MCSLYIHVLHFVHFNWHATAVSTIFLASYRFKSRSMAPRFLQCFMLVLVVFISNFSVSLHASQDPPLTLDYYKSTCPTILEIVRKEMECAVLSDPRNAALILRLHFHDCFVQVDFDLL